MKSAGSPTNQAAILRGKLSAATKRANDEREFALKQLAENANVKDELQQAINIAVIAVKALEFVHGDEVIYFVQQQLRDELLRMWPGLGKGGYARLRTR